MIPFIKHCKENDLIYSIKIDAYSRDITEGYEWIDLHLTNM